MTELRKNSVDVESVEDIERSHKKIELDGVQPRAAEVIENLHGLMTGLNGLAWIRAAEILLEQEDPVRAIYLLSQDTRAH